MWIQKKEVFSFAVALLMASAASAQRRASPAVSGETGVAITLQVAGQRYQFQGKAECGHAPVASIYHVMAEMWRVQQTDGQRSIMLTLWRPKNGTGEMFSLSVGMGAKSYLVNTVRLGGETAVQGSGKVTLTPSAAGGTFTINATAPNNASITGTIQCTAFTQPEAVGG